MRTWTEDRGDIAPARATMTTRAGIWATRQVGGHVHSVSWAAKELGVGWHTVMDAVTFWGTLLVEDPDRVGATTAVGVDETSFLAATATMTTQWVSSICDVEGGIVLDLIEGRGAPELDRWLEGRPQEWITGVGVTVSDLHEPFRAALARHLPATAAAAPFYVVAVGTRCVDAHPAADPERDHGPSGPQGRPALSEPQAGGHGRGAPGRGGHRQAAGTAGRRRPPGPRGRGMENRQECLRELYRLYGEPEVAGRWIDGLIEDWKRRSVGSLPLTKSIPDG